MFLIASLLLLVLSGLLLSGAGNSWPWFAITVGCASLAAVAGPKWYRLAGIAVAAVSSALLVFDLKAGAEYRKRLEKVHNHSVVLTTPNGEPGGPANGSQPSSSDEMPTSGAAASRR